MNDPSIAEPVSGSRPTRARSLPFVGTVALWLVFQGWRPFLLAPFTDDWGWFRLADEGAPFSLARLLSPLIWPWNSSRPGYGLIMYLNSSLAGQSGVTLRFLGAIAILAAALSLHLFVREVLDNFGLPSGLPAVFAVFFFLAAPWCVFSKAFLTLSLCYWPACLFFLSGWVLVRSAGRGRVSWLLPSALLAASLLTYETFYFQCLVLLAVAALLLRRQGRHLQELWRPALAFSLVQLAAIAYNRLAGSPKQFGGLLLTGAKLLNNLTIGPVEALVASMTWWTLPFLAGVLLVGGQVRAARRRDASAHQDLDLLLLAIAGGAALGVATYALGGYTVTGRNAGATFSSDMWLGALCAICLAILAVRPPSGLGRRAGGLALAVLSLSGASAARHLDWIEASGLQERLLRRAPVDAIRATPRDAVIFYDGEISYRGVRYWEALSLQTALLARTGVDRRFYVADEALVSWTPSLVTADVGALGYPKQPAIPVHEPWYYWGQDDRLVRLDQPRSSRDGRVDDLPLYELIQQRHWVTRIALRWSGRGQRR